MNKKEIAKHMVTVGIFTLITTFIIVSLQSYRNLVKQREEVGKGLMLELIDPDIKMDVLDEIQDRKEYSFKEIKNITPTQVPTITPSQETDLDNETLLATPSGGQTDE